MDDIKVICEDISPVETIKHINEIVKENWISSYPYSSSRSIEFSSKPLPEDFLNDDSFRVHSLYMNSLYQSLSREISDIDDKNIIEEVTYWNDKGGLCIYLSVLLYSLLMDMKLCNRNNLRFIQGYSQYQPTNPIFSLISDNTTITNFHSWISYKDSVLDFSVGQEKSMLDIGNTEYILGNIPKAILMIGFKESHETVGSYIHKFSSRINLSEKEWLSSHRLNSYKTALNMINSKKTL